MLGVQGLWAGRDVHSGLLLKERNLKLEYEN
jgi:hypothetical protein